MSSKFIYYVYAYIREDGTPYYIGKGCKNRINDSHHFKLPTKNRRVILHSNLTDFGSCAIERSLIRWYGKKIDGGILINLTDGGTGGDTSQFRKTYKHTKETKIKISQAKQGDTPWNKDNPGYSTSKKGYVTPEKTKIKISQALKGKKKDPASVRKGHQLTDEHKENISQGLKGKVVSQETKEKISHSNKGRNLTEEHKQNLSKINKGKILSQEVKEKLKGWVICVNEQGETIRVPKEVFDADDTLVGHRSKEGQRRKLSSHSS